MPQNAHTTSNILLSTPKKSRKLPENTNAFSFCCWCCLAYFCFIHGMCLLVRILFVAAIFTLHDIWLTCLGFEISMLCCLATASMTLSRACSFALGSSPCKWELVCLWKWLLSFLFTPFTPNTFHCRMCVKTRTRPYQNKHHAAIFEEIWMLKSTGVKLKA